MKSLLKYITLLLVGGVIIPFYYQYKGSVKTKPVIIKALSVNTSKAGNAYQFSFTDDVLSKLLPGIKYFQLHL